MSKPRPQVHPPSSGRDDAGERAHGLLTTVDRYAATFDLMLAAWRDRSIYATVGAELDAVAASQKSQAPEAGLAMLELAIAHNDVAAALMARQLAGDSGTGDADLARRQQRHTAAVAELRSYVLRKIH